AGTHRVGRIGPGNTITEYVPPDNDGAYKVTAVAPDGGLWTTTPFAVNFSGLSGFFLQSSLIDRVALSAMPLDSPRTISVPPAAPPAVRTTADGYQTVSGFPLNVAAPGLLGNDHPGLGSSLTAVLASGPAHGSVALQADGSFTYTPAAGFAGTDQFT